MTGESSWVGIHKCGGLLSAIPNSSKKEAFSCAIESCDSESPLEDENYFVFKQEELSENLTATDIENLSREDRKKIVECKEKENAIDMAVELKEEDRLSTF
jgi:hypothetical protein